MEAMAAPARGCGCGGGARGRARGVVRVRRRAPGVAPAAAPEGAHVTVGPRGGAAGSVGEAGARVRPPCRARSPTPITANTNRCGRRGALGALGAAALAAQPLARAPPAAAEALPDDNDESSRADALPAWSFESLGAAEGWLEAPGGARYRVLRAGEGDAAAGVLDPVSSYQPFPFVEVTFAAYTPDGRCFAGTRQDRRATRAYQVGIRQQLEDEPGAVIDMVVGERRQFAVPFDVVMENISGGKLFGEPAPEADALLVDVTLVALRPY